MQAAHHALLVALAEKVELFHGLFHVPHHAGHLVGGGQIALGYQVAHVLVGLAEQFVTHHLHGLRQIEREIIGVAGNGHQAVAVLHFVNAQAEGFVAEHQCHGLSGLCGGQQAGGEFARGLQRGGEFAAAAGEGAAQHGAGQCFGQAAHNHGVFQYVGRSGGEREAFFGQAKMCRLLWVEHGRVRCHRRLHEVGRYQIKAAQSHGFHGARGGTDIGRMAGAAQYDADIGKIGRNGRGHDVCVKKGSGYYSEIRGEKQPAPCFSKCRLLFQAWEGVKAGIPAARYLSIHPVSPSASPRLRQTGQFRTGCNGTPGRPPSARSHI